MRCVGTPSKRKGDGWISGIQVNPIVDLNEEVEINADGVRWLNLFKPLVGTFSNTSVEKNTPPTEIQK